MIILITVHRKPMQFRLYDRQGNSSSLTTYKDGCHTSHTTLELLCHTFCSVVAPPPSLLDNDAIRQSGRPQLVHKLLDASFSQVVLLYILDAHASPTLQQHHFCTGLQQRHT